MKAQTLLMLAVLIAGILFVLGVVGPAADRTGEVFEPAALTPATAAPPVEVEIP